MLETNSRLTRTSRFNAGMSGNTFTEAKWSVVGAKNADVCCSGSMTLLVGTQNMRG